MKLGFLGTALAVSFLLLASCQSMIGGILGDALSAPGSNTVFTGDDDPQLVGDALPFAIKMYESVLAMVPTHPGMELMVGSLYVMYANAFVAGPAAFLPAERAEDKQNAQLRAKKLYLRGHALLVRSLDRRYPGFKAAFAARDLKAVLAKMAPSDASFLYWAAASWFGAASLDNLDTNLGVHLSDAKQMMDRAYVLNPDYNDGAIDDFFIQFYSSMPDGLGHDPGKAAFHYSEALRKAKGKKAGPYLSWAESVALPAQNRALFEELLGKVLAIDPKADPNTTLENVLTQNKARFYQKSLDELFWQ